MNNNQQGILLIELLIYVTIIGLITSYAVPKISMIYKRMATKNEMALLASTILYIEQDTGSLPTSLTATSLTAYYNGTAYQKDEFGVSYTYSTSSRTLCSTSFSPTYCESF